MMKRAIAILLFMSPPVWGMGLQPIQPTAQPGALSGMGRIQSALNETLGDLIALGMNVGTMDNLFLGNIPPAYELNPDLAGFKAFREQNPQQATYMSGRVLGPMRDQIFDIARKLQAVLRGTGALIPQLEAANVDDLISQLDAMGDVGRVPVSQFAR